MTLSCQNQPKPMNLVLAPWRGTVLVNTGTQLHPGLGHWMPGNPGGRDNINPRYLELVHMIIIAPPLCTDL